MRAVFEFQKTADNESDAQTIGGSLTFGFTDPVTSIGIVGTASLKISSKNSELNEKVQVKFFGDTVLETAPTTLSDARTLISRLPKLAQKGDAVIDYTITPINRYCDESSARLRKLNDKIYVEIGNLFKNIERTKLELNDLIERTPVRMYRQTIGKYLKKFVNKFMEYEIEWSEKLGTLLTKAQGSRESEGKVVQHLAKYKKGPFAFNKMEVFLNNRRRELDTLELISNTNTNDTNIVVDQSSTADGNKCLFDHTYTIEYVTYVLPSIDIVEFYINGSKESTSHRYNERNMWFWDEQVVAQAGARQKFFLDFHEWNKKQETDIDEHGAPTKHDELVCYLVRLSPKTEDIQRNLTSVIRVLDKGEDVIKDMWPRPKLTLPKTIEMSRKKIEFTLDFGVDNQPFPGVDTKFYVNYTYEYESNETTHNTTRWIITQDVTLSGTNATIWTDNDNTEAKTVPPDSRIDDTEEMGSPSRVNDTSENNTTLQEETTASLVEGRMEKDSPRNDGSILALVVQDTTEKETTTTSQVDDTTENNTTLQVETTTSRVDDTTKKNTTLQEETTTTWVYDDVKKEATTVRINNTWNQTTLYDFKISFRFPFGIAPDTIEFTVNYTVLSCPRIKTANATEKSLSWNPPKDYYLIEDDNGNLTYKITYTQTENRRGGPNIIITRNTSITIYDLDIFSHFTLEVVTKDIVPSTSKHRVPVIVAKHDVLSVDMTTKENEIAEKCATDDDWKTIINDDKDDLKNDTTDNTKGTMTGTGSKIEL